MANFYKSFKQISIAINIKELNNNPWVFFFQVSSKYYLTYFTL